MFVCRGYGDMEMKNNSDISMFLGTVDFLANVVRNKLVYRYHLACKSQWFTRLFHQSSARMVKGQKNVWHFAGYILIIYHITNNVEDREMWSNECKMCPLGNSLLRMPLRLTWQGTRSQVANLFWKACAWCIGSMHLYTHAHALAHAHAHTHTHIHIHTDTHTHTLSLSHKTIAQVGIW